MGKGGRNSKTYAFYRSLFCLRKEARCSLGVTPRTGPLHGRVVLPACTRVNCLYPLRPTETTGIEMLAHG